MSSTAANDAEDVNDFLKRIQELGTKRDEEDEERNRKLEQEILQGRKERQARRAERARSISPSKDSPASTPPQYKPKAEPPRSASRAAFSPAPEMQPTTRDKVVEDAMERLTGAASPTKENTTPSATGDHRDSTADLRKQDSFRASPSSAMPPSRSSTLSWQRRPNSQASDRPRSRPLSMIATENAARSPRATPEPQSDNAETASVPRDQISQMLSSKDPAWFRQTADRGDSSPAYRKSQVEDNNVVEVVSSSRVQLPGMLREPTRDSSGDNYSGPDIDRSVSPPRNRSSTASAGKSSYTGTSLVSNGLGSPIPLTSAQRFDPPGSSSANSIENISLTSERAIAMSPAQGRISPERLDRSPSPTKGMGGFVQSAMMKRSDSVNKRWSVQSPPGLSRGNSVASNRSSYEPTASLNLGGIPSREPRPSSLSRDNSPLPLSRPTSSQSNVTIVQETERPGTSGSMNSTATISTTNDSFVKPFLPASKSQTPIDSREIMENSPTDLKIQTTPPTSPSKVNDARRWSPTKSPTKSSWLESALNKPESPKPKATQPTSQKPAWMTEINKAKQRSSADTSKTSPIHKHEVKIGGLIRSPPPGGLAKPLSIGGLPSGFSSGSVVKSFASTSSSTSNNKSPEISSEALQRVTGNQPGPILSPKPSAPKVNTPSTDITSTPASGKVKPETPPKKDFRANLKSRTLPTANEPQEPEFKNALGQLRRTKTQNYVAPDELKNNILRGKADLNLTGGPKKSERKDEFKEAILKKKDDFKKAQLEGTGVKQSTSGSNQPSAPLPEALAKKAALGRSNVISARERESMDVPPSSFSKASLPIETSTPDRLQSKDVSGNKLADRFNPALAGILARGPPLANEKIRTSSPIQSQRPVSTSTSVDQVPESGPQLTHMTKARARGPRRKAPTNVASSNNASNNSVAETSKVSDVSVSKVLEDRELPIKDILSKPEVASAQFELENERSQPSSPRKLDMKRRSRFLEEVSNKNEKTSQGLDSPKPLPPKKANIIEIHVTKTGPATEVLAPEAEPTVLNTPSSDTVKTLQEQGESSLYSSPRESKKSDSTPLSPSKFKIPKPNKKLVLDGQASRESERVSLTTVTVVPFASGNIQAALDPEQLTKLPTRVDEDLAAKDATSAFMDISSKGKQASSLDGSQRLIKSDTFKSAHVAPTTPEANKPIPPAKPAASSLSSTTLNPTSPRKLQTQSSEASGLLIDFFGKNEFVSGLSIDTAAVLSSKSDEIVKIKTLRSQLFLLAADGKKHQVPTHQERVLFEGNMYLCIHTFGTPAGKKIIEVYFWAGDAVPEVVIEDTDIFAQREARSASGKLIRMRQGKETSEFIEALGGIMIIRRGTSNKFDSLAPHILCGRRFAGQIVFDEVDFAPTSLCSGFPYLISSQSGKSYLWKGKGSGIDELSCARLIGMDFGLTGEIEEIEDGKEPLSFLEVFGRETKIMKSADHWRLKPSYHKYRGRLFCADSTSKSQITEIAPFSQADISPASIYILDAFFEVYIIVGARSQAQFTSFCAALLFAQEYGILAAGMEDRPFVPVSTVVFEGVPRDLKFVFRKWSNSLTPTIVHSPTTTLSRGRSLRVVPLNAALDATRF